MKSLWCRIGLTALLLWSGLSVQASVPLEPQLAFDGALGFGRYTQGGKGGTELTVTSLADPPELTPGTLRWAVTRPYPRTVTFSVSGVIQLTRPLEIRGDFLTVDGRSSPGGIVISGGETQISANQVILRYLRFRPGHLSPEGDALTARRQHHIIVDHCSLSWANDEVGSFYNNQYFTLQYSLLSDSLTNAGHHKGEHGYGGIWGGSKASFLRNVIANHSSRNPRINGYRLGALYPQEEELTDIRNNVIFNWGFKAVYGAEGGRFNLVSNYFKPGPASAVNWIFELWQRPDITGGQAYIDGNLLVSKTSSEAPPQPVLTVAESTREAASQRLQALLVNQPLSAEPSTLSAQESYELLIEGGEVGANLPFQDSVDRRVLEMIRHPQAITGKGLIDSELEVIGSWEAYQREFKQTRTPD